MENSLFESYRKMKNQPILVFSMISVYIVIAIYKKIYTFNEDIDYESIYHYNC